MPVVLAPAKPLKRFDKQNMMVEVNNGHLDQSNEESKEYMLPPQVPMTINDINHEEDVAPFMQLIVSHAESSGYAPQQRLRSLQFAIQEFIF